MSALTGTFIARAIRAMRANISSRGMRSPSGYPREKAIPAEVVAMAGKPASSKTRALATSQALGSTSAPGPRCRCRNCIALSAWESMSFFSSQTILAPASSLTHPLQETRNMNHGAAHGPAPDFLYAVVCRNAHDVETSVERFQFRRRANAHPDPACRPVFDVNRNADRDFSIFTVRLQCFETGGFHQPDHVGRGVHRRQFRMMCGQRMPQFHRFLGFAAYADGDRKGHGLLKKVRG